VSRTISHSEISTMLGCQQRHAYQYTGALTGGVTLKPAETHQRLKSGKAMHAALEVWHTGGTLQASIEALTDALAEEESC